MENCSNKENPSENPHMIEEFLKDNKLVMNKSCVITDFLLIPNQGLPDRLLNSFDGHR